MATKIIVINRALAGLGSERLMSETDNNKASRSIETIYDGLLDRMLRAYRWAFAIKRVKLPALSQRPEYGYRFAYQLPADCLRIDAVGDNIFEGYRSVVALRKPLWQREGKTIVSDIEAPLYLRYGARITDPGQWDASFTDAFCCLLSAALAEPVTQSSAKKQAALKDLDTAIKEARSVSAIERQPIQQQETSWLTSRL